jgi:hypothetical protein
VKKLDPFFRYISLGAVQNFCFASFFANSLLQIFFSLRIFRFPSFSLRIFRFASIDMRCEKAPVSTFGVFYKKETDWHHCSTYHFCCCWGPDVVDTPSVPCVSTIVGIYAVALAVLFLVFPQLFVSLLL